MITLAAGEVASLATGRLLNFRDDAVFRLEGPGVVDCLQGLLTNDVRAGGDQGLVWGAILTPKGMIISDAWILRQGATVATVMVPAKAHEAIRALFQKTLPPRLARCTDLTGQDTVGWLMGAPGEAGTDNEAQPHGPAPFKALIVVKDQAQAARDRSAAGWRVVPSGYGEASKLLMGWPTLGREIDERTLVQEVRFDELAGVRYDKGCYTGQETVARLHFRGHPNRALRGIIWPAGTEPSSREVIAAGKQVGTLGTVGRLGRRTLALAVIRREVAIGDQVSAGESEGEVVELPFAPESMTTA